MNIPDEAVASAMKVFYRYGYSNFAEAELAFAEAQTRAALEAAAPHIAARALEEAAEFVRSPRAKPTGADLARSDAVRNWLRKRAAHILAGDWDRSVTW